MLDWLYVGISEDGVYSCHVANGVKMVGKDFCGDVMSHVPAVVSDDVLWSCEGGDHFGMVFGRSDL